MIGDLDFALASHKPMWVHFHHAGWENNYELQEREKDIKEIEQMLTVYGLFFDDLLHAPTAFLFPVMKTPHVNLICFVSRYIYSPHH